MLFHRTIDWHNKKKGVRVGICTITLYKTFFIICKIKLQATSLTIKWTAKANHKGSEDIFTEMYLIYLSKASDRKLITVNLWENEMAERTLKWIAL